MYDELVKRLRELQILTEHCDEQSCLECKNRKLCDKYDNKTVNRTYKEAANAIEELCGLCASQSKDCSEAVAKYIELWEKQPRWIPVTEGLPKAERESYWVCTDTGYQCECRWTNNRFGIGESDEWGWSIFDIPQYQKVIAWMPLPQPPKKE